MLMDDWDSLITEVEAEHFVGREQELDLFQREITLPTPRWLIFYITGQGGSGKTTLLKHYQKIAREHHFLVAECDEQQKDVPAVLGQFAQQLAEAHAKLENFEKRYKVYLQHKDEIENDPEAPQGFAAFLGKTLVRATYMVGDTLPGIRKGLEYLPQDALESQASDWMTYLAKKLSNKDDRALIRDPVSHLAPLFFEDLNLVASKRPVLLCFENFEAVRPEVQTWLYGLREYKPKKHIRLAIAGRDPLTARWDSLRAMTKVISLDVFTVEEAQLFLDTYGITDQHRRAEILHWSGRLPVLMSWLAAPQGDVPDPSTPVHDVVERFLRWVTEPAQRRIALLAAFPRTFNLDILHELLDHKITAQDEQAAFNWLQSMPFVQLRSAGWQYHAVVRRMMLRYQRQSSPQGYTETHLHLANWYQALCQKRQAGDDDKWRDDHWRDGMLSYLYHALAADPSRHWEEMVSLFVIALRQQQEFAREIIELLSSEDIQDELQPNQRETVQLFDEQFQEFAALRTKNSLALFEYICHLQNLSPEAKQYALAYRGQIYSLHGQEALALTDFEQALSFDSSNVQIIAMRGIAYSNMGRHEEALQDLNRASELAPMDASIYRRRASVYAMKGRLNEALQDINRAIELAPKDTSAYGIRGNIYREMKRYEEAIADFNRAIELDAHSAWAFAGRGWVYESMEQYTEALTDFSHAIALDAKNSSFFSGRGITYLSMQKHTEALADFSQALELDAHNIPTLSTRGDLYQKMQRDAEALADFKHATELDANNVIELVARGNAYQKMQKYAEALADYNRAIELVANNAYYWTARGNAYQKMQKYAEALADYSHAIELDANNALILAVRGEFYSNRGQYAEALADFNRSIALDTSDASRWAARGDIYCKLERLEEALIDYSHVIALDEKNVQAIVARAGCYMHLGRMVEALADLNQAVELDAKNARAIIQRGSVCLLLGKYAEALADLQRAIELDTNNIQMLLWRGECYRLLEKYAKALTDFTNAIKLDANNALAVAQRGITYRLMGKTAEALADFNRVIQLDANTAQTIAQRGVIYRLMGKTTEALADFNRAIQLDANNGAYRYCRAQIAYLLHQEHDFVRDMDAAIELVKSSRAPSSNVPKNWELDLNLALYHLFRMDYAEACRLYDQLLTLYIPALYLRSAVEALKDLLTIQPQNKLIPVIQLQLRNRISELEATEVQAK
jgi:tetratricopeptide (TPR) repeat protein